MQVYNQCHENEFSIQFGPEKKRQNQKFKKNF